MSKLDRIRHFLNENKAGLAIVSDPVTVNYLTGFDCDPHERQMFLFVYENREPALFVPALEVARASAVLDFPVFGYVDSENPWQKIKAGLASTDSSIIYAEFDNLNVTKFQGLQTVFEGRFENLTPFIQKMRVIKSADEIQKMIGAGDYADKAVNIGFDNISLDVTETDIIAQIEFGMKKIGINQMSFETMVLTGNNAANPHGIPEAGPGPPGACCKSPPPKLWIPGRPSCGSQFRFRTKALNGGFPRPARGPCRTGCAWPHTPRSR